MFNFVKIEKYYIIYYLIMYNSLTDVKSFKDLVSDNNEKDIKILKELMLIGLNVGFLSDDIFNPNLFIKSNQSTIIDRINQKYKGCNNKILIYKKLIQYLSFYNDIYEIDYKEYILLNKQLKTIPDKTNNKEKKELYNKILNDKSLNINLRLYCYFKLYLNELKPIKLVEITLDKSDNYIDFINNKIIIFNKEISIKSIDILKILLITRPDDEYIKLFEDEELLKKELNTVRTKFLFEKKNGKFKSSDLIKLLIYYKSKK
jgi:hypothetical protein